MRKDIIQGVGININKRLFIKPAGADLQSVPIKTASKLKTHKRQVCLTIFLPHGRESLLPICDSISYLNNGKIEFTKEKENFNEIENDIFAVHQDNLDKKIQELIG